MNGHQYEWANSPQTWPKGFAIFQKWKSFPAANVIHLNTIAVKIWLLTVTMKNENILEVSCRFDRSWVSMKIWMKRIFCGGFIKSPHAGHSCVRWIHLTHDPVGDHLMRKEVLISYSGLNLKRPACVLFIPVCVWFFLNPVQTLLTKNSEYTQLR